MQQTNNRGLQIGPYRFTPSWFLILVTLIVLSILMNLGFWQLRRAEFKQDQINQIDAFRAKISSESSSYEQFIHYYSDYGFALNEAQINISGSYVPPLTVLYDNRVHNRQVGYQVLSLFRPVDSETHLLINRGWIPLPELRRDILPEIDIPTLELSLSGKLWIPNPDLLTFTSEIFLQKEQTIVAQKLDLTQLAQQLGVQLAPFIMKLDNTEPHGFVREWTPVTEIGTSPEKHQGYAVQWFTMSLAVFIIFIVTNTKRSEAE